MTCSRGSAFMISSGLVMGLRVAFCKLFFGGFTQRQEQRHARACAFLTLDQELATVSIDDALHDRQPQAGAAGPRGEERVERALSHFGLHAVAVILDLNRDRGSAAGKLVACHHDVHATASLHRLASVLHQIVEHEPEQVRVDPDGLDLRIGGERSTLTGRANRSRSVTNRLRRAASSSTMPRSVLRSSSLPETRRRPATALTMIASGFLTSCAIAAASSPTVAN